MVSVAVLLLVVDGLLFSLVRVLVLGVLMVSLQMLLWCFPLHLRHRFLELQLDM